MTGAGDYATHDVLNQPPELADYNAYQCDATLQSVVRNFDAAWAELHLSATGISVGSAHVRDLAEQANRFPPELRTHDRYGHRIDRVDFHPAWHELMALIIAHETHSLAWTQPQPGAQVARAALLYLWSQGENGICCPVSMTHAAIPVLRKEPAIAAEWEPRLLSTRYDSRQIAAAAKSGATAGMAMTEKQGGSDLRQTQTTATSNGDGTWSIVGHKWFFSAPHSDVFLTLARTEKGVSCFVVAGWLPDGSRNRLLIQRLKNKCGNRSNASSEVEFRGALGRLLGEEGHGIRILIEMAHLTRLDCAASSAALMHHAVIRAVHHCRHRRAFQRCLIDQPIMANVLADLSIEAQAATWLTFRFVAALDREQNESERLLGRIGAPIAKYWACKRTPAVVAEALECQGGNAFVEDNPMARLYREAPLNSLWEGSGNVMCLDLLRSIAQEPGALPLLIDEISEARGADRRFDAFLDRMSGSFSGAERDEGQARRLVATLALALSASLLIRHAPQAVADAFVASRLGGNWSGHFGDLPAGIDAGALAQAISPEV
jgi:putative acyl-CoA dehydrogenase